MEREIVIAEAVREILDERFPEDTVDVKAAAAIDAAAQYIAEERDPTQTATQDDRETIERYGRAFDRILLMVLSD
jgi:hypothetical protein